YVGQLLSGDLVRLVRHRPVLGRLLSQSINQWVVATADLCRRFALDFSLLKETFGWNNTSFDAAIETVRTDLSDRHDGGQTVAELFLNSGSRLIYKPRTVKAEAVFNQFLSRLNSEQLSLPLRTLKIVDRCDYGWCEVAVPAACDTL